MRSVWSAVHSTNRLVFYTYRRLSRCSSAGFMLLLAAALTSCDAHLPLQPNGGAVSPGPQTVTSASGAGSQLVGTYTAPTTWATPGRVTTYQPLTPTGIMLEANRYFLLRVGGIMQVEANPYTAGAVAGKVLHAYSAYESSQSTGRGLTRVTLADGSRTSGMLLSGFRVDEGGEDMILLVRAGPEGSNLLAERWMMPGRDLKWGYCPLRPYCPHDEVLQPDTVHRIAITIEDYWISVPHVVSATEIFEPLTLDASPLVPGTPMTVEALPFDGLRIRTREGFPAGVRWLWYPGDTASTPNPYISGYTPPGCTWDKMVCEFTPTKPGRMVVSTTLEGADVRVSQVLKVQESKLELTCPESIMRGEEMTCTASTNPRGASLEVTGWDFVASEIGYRNPAAGATPFRGTAWEGKMVVSGTVTVHARLAGADTSASAEIVVTARDWSSKTMAKDAAEEPFPADEEMRADPDSIQELGHIHNDLSLELTRNAWEPILSGPNANLAYLVDPPVSYQGRIHVNRTALAVGSEFWNAQYRQQRSANVVDCLQREEDIIGFIPVILRHEGEGFDPKSHAYLFTETFNRVGNPRFERVIGSSVAELADRSEAIAMIAGDSATAASGLADTRYAPQWCRFNFNYAGR